MYIEARFPGGYFLRESDLEEYLHDLEVERGGEIQPGLGHLRSHEINLDEPRWPIAMMTDYHDVMASLTSRQWVVIGTNRGQSSYLAC
jgi:hypothetical protein